MFYEYLYLFKLFKKKKTYNMNEFGEERSKKKYLSNKPFPSFLQVFELGVFRCYEALHPYLPMKQTKNKQRRIKGRGA